MSRPRISLGALGGLVGRRRQLDAAGLAAAADQHLRLDDDGAADLGGRRPRLLGRERDAPVGDGDAEAREELLALVLVEIHASEASRSRHTVNATCTVRVFGSARADAFSEFFVSCRSEAAMSSAVPARVEARHAHARPAVGRDGDVLLGAVDAHDDVRDADAAAAVGHPEAQLAVASRTA